MAEERVSNEDMERTYQKGYEDGFKAGQETERPRAFGAGYKAGFDNGSRILRCSDCKFKRLYDDGETKYYYCALEDRPNRNWSVDDWDFCSWAERREQWRSITEQMI